MFKTHSSLHTSLLLLALSLGLCLVGCGSSNDDDDDSSDDDDDSSSDDDDATDDDDDSAPAFGGGLNGTVTRTGPTVTGQDGIGGLVITVLGQNPKSGPPGKPFADSLTPDADFSANGATVAYSVTGIPPRPEPYFITAWLDDDNSGTNSGPNSNDIVGTPVEITIDQPEDQTLNLELLGPLN